MLVKPINASSAGEQFSRASDMRSGRSYERAIGKDGKRVSGVSVSEITLVRAVGFGATLRCRLPSVSVLTMSLERKMRSSSLLALAFLLPACAGPTSSTPTIEHSEVIAEQWGIAQNVLAPAVPQAHKVKWSSFGWEAYDGPVQCGDREWPVNGCFLGGTIRWNINTPGVIQHEAAHAILRALVHPCWKYVSLNSGKITLHWQEKESPYCEEWICGNFGGDCESKN